MIWVIGGTKDSRDFLEKIVDVRKDIVVTTATEYGGKLLENLPLKVICRKLTYPEMLEFVEDEKIEIVIDLSHPYAVEVSQNALNLAKELKIDYYRFERKETFIYPKKYSSFETIEGLISYVESLDENILVTLGSNNIPSFAQLKNLKNCYFRILPKWDMVKRCEDFGILPKNIIAMQGPFTKEMNIAMINQYDIKYLITKQAGDTGGEKEKIEACEETSIETIFLSRPHLDYPNSFDDIETLAEVIKKI